MIIAAYSKSCIKNELQHIITTDNVGSSYLTETHTPKKKNINLPALNA